MSAANRKLQVFLCHASQDKNSVRKLFKRLKTEGWIKPWLDEEDLLPGQEWAKEIPRAVREMDVVIVCLSRNSVTKEGYIQREISYALDIAEEKPEGTIFIIPIRIEDCQVPGRLRRWQWLDYYDENAHAKLLKSLQYRAEGLQLTSSVSPEKLELMPPVGETMSTYVFGDDLYEESFSIDTLLDEFLGEYGVSVAASIGKSEPKRVAALDVWLFDKNDINTACKVLMSSRTYYDHYVRKSVEKKGELILIEPQKQISLETVSLQMLVTVIDLEYGKQGAPENSFFERVTLHLAVWPKL